MNGRIVRFIGLSVVLVLCVFGARAMELRTIAPSGGIFCDPSGQTMAPVNLPVDVSTSKKLDVWFKGAQRDLGANNVLVSLFTAIAQGQTDSVIQLLSQDNSCVDKYYCDACPLLLAARYCYVPDDKRNIATVLIDDYHALEKLQWDLQSFNQILWNVMQAAGINEDYVTCENCCAYDRCWECPGHDCCGDYVQGKDCCCWPQCPCAWQARSIFPEDIRQPTEGEIKTWTAEQRSFWQHWYARRCKELIIAIIKISAVICTKGLRDGRTFSSEINLTINDGDVALLHRTFGNYWRTFLPVGLTAPNTSVGDALRVILLIGLHLSNQLRYLSQLSHPTIKVSQALQGVNIGKMQQTLNALYNRTQPVDANPITLPCCGCCLIL